MFLGISRTLSFYRPIIGIVWLQSEQIPCEMNQSLRLLMISLICIQFGTVNHLNCLSLCNPPNSIISAHNDGHVYVPFNNFEGFYGFLRFPVCSASHRPWLCLCCWFSQDNAPNDSSATNSSQYAPPTAVLLWNVSNTRCRVRCVLARIHRRRACACAALFG